MGNESEVLFEVKKEHLETGLRGIPVGYCSTSTVDPIKGLFYRGQAVSSLARRTPEEVIYLLLRGKEPNEKEANSFREELQRRGKCSEILIKQIQALSANLHPMKLFSIALMLLSAESRGDDYESDALDLIAKVPEIVAVIINHHAGWGGLKPANPSLGYMDNFVEMVNVPSADQKGLAELFRLFNILHYDHGGGNLSTFVGKAVASSLADLGSSMAAAMNGLNGPRHGRANEDALNFVTSILEEVGENGQEQEVEAAIRRRLAKGDLIFGFGHAVLRVEDPRATIFYELAKERYSSHPLVRMALLLRSVTPKVLRENPKISNPYPNVDAISGTLLSAAGFPYRDYFTLLFGLSRVVGISIQIVYERCKARSGKGTPIVRPKYLYLEEKYPS